jgi:hypothetical protein
MNIIQTKVYTLNELDDKAKENARNWYRESFNDDSFWSECVVDDFTRLMGLMGWTIKHVYWAGFSSQGDGAMFEGVWSASNTPTDAVTKLKSEAPNEKELRTLAGCFVALASRHPEGYCKTKHSGYYYHAHCVEYTTEGLEGESECDIEELARDCMRWVYYRLEEGYDYQNADEQVDETIKANEYTFTETGRRFG